MTDARHLLRVPGTLVVLELVQRVPRSGEDLATAMGLTLIELAEIAEPMWAAKLLQGEVADGCCRDPCGTTCVSNRMDRVWSLSRKGASALNHSSRNEPALSTTAAYAFPSKEFS